MLRCTSQAHPCACVAKYIRKFQVPLTPLTRLVSEWFAQIVCGIFESAFQITPKEPVTSSFLRMLCNNKKALISSRLFLCRRWDLNPHDIATTGTWSLRVCQFRHSCEQMIFYRFNGNKSTPIFNFFPFFEKIYKIDKNRKKLKIGIDNCPGICYYLQVVMRRKFIRYAEVSELADEQD